jgi:chromosome segregation ATPase
LGPLDLHRQVPRPCFLEVFYMSDATGGTRVPQTFGEKLSFSLPVILVTLVLALGLGAVIVAIVNNKLDKRIVELNSAKETMDVQLGEVKKNNETLTTQVDTLKAENETLKAEKTKLEKHFNMEVDKVKLSSSEMKLDLDKFRKGQEKLDMDQNKDITETKGTVANIDRKVVYLENEMKKLNQIEKDVSELKVDSGSLKEEHTKLKAEITAVGKKADVTEKDLQDLGERAKAFQLRVLHARAREAVDAARASDLRQLLERLEDVEGGK